MANTSENFSNHMREMNDNVKDSASRAMGEVREGVGKIGSAISEASGETMREAGKVATEAYDNVRAKGHEQARLIGDSIKEAPLLSLGLAFLGGILLGAIARRA